MGSLSHPQHHPCCRSQERSKPGGGAPKAAPGVGAQAKCPILLGTGLGCCKGTRGGPEPFGGAPAAAPTLSAAPFPLVLFPDTAVWGLWGQGAASRLGSKVWLWGQGAVSGSGWSGCMAWGSLWGAGCAPPKPQPKILALDLCPYFGGLQRGCAPWGGLVASPSSCVVSRGLAMRCMGTGRPWWVKFGVGAMKEALCFPEPAEEN